MSRDPRDAGSTRKRSKTFKKVFEIPDEDDDAPVVAKQEPESDGEVVIVENSRGLKKKALVERHRSSPSIEGPSPKE